MFFRKRKKVRRGKLKRKINNKRYQRDLGINCTNRSLIFIKDGGKDPRITQ